MTREYNRTERLAGLQANLSQPTISNHILYFIQNSQNIRDLCTEQNILHIACSLDHIGWENFMEGRIPKDMVDWQQQYCICPKCPDYQVIHGDHNLYTTFFELLLLLV